MKTRENELKVPTRTPRTIALDIVGRGKGTHYPSRSDLRRAIEKAIEERDAEWRLAIIEGLMRRAQTR